MRIAPGALIILTWLTPGFADDLWSAVSTPLDAPSQAIGSYNAGCLAGAAALPLKGRGFQVMRPSRNRYYGHPKLIAFIDRLGRQAATRGERLFIGDLSQPRGGPMKYGHRSHQIGLDVDIWFYQAPFGRDLSRQETEQLPMVSMVAAREGRLDPGRWSPRYRDILKLAAEAPEVERIFVNPIIKQALCRAEQGRGWLRKIRPWWGHDEHFHVRLGCPADNPHCRDQDPLPLDDGCDTPLDQWVTEIQMAATLPPKPPGKPGPAPVLPELCKAVLNSGLGLRSVRLTKPDS